jgi:N-acetylglutamate synthase-like GNAT family acetyltransferase
VLAGLDRDDAAFDVLGRGGPRGALRPEAAAAYLADPAVLHWVAEEEAGVVGHLLCYVERRRRGDERQLLLYEIGVRSDRRRRGVGRALVDAMDEWMRGEGIPEVWVLADPEAEEFYAACGFARSVEPAVPMERRV